MSALWQCRRQGGDTRLSPAAGMSLLWGRVEEQQQRLLSGAAAGASRVAAVQGRTGAGLGRQERAGQGRKRLWAQLCKGIPLGAAPWPKCSLFGAQLQLPSSAGRSQSSAALARSSGGGGWHSHVCCSPFAPARQPNTSPQRFRREASGAGSTLRPQTSRAGTVAELQAAAEQTNPVIQPRGHL